MNPRITLLFFLGLALVGILSSGVLRGQVHEQSPNLTVFFTGDQDGEVASCGCPKEDYGGTTRRAAFFDTLRTSGWKFLTLDAGDMTPFDGLTAQNRMKIETLARAMATMGYDAVTLGDHDLAPGPEFVADLVGWLGQPVMATNYDLPGGQSERTRRVEVAGKTVGIVAFFDPTLGEAAGSWLELEPWEDQERYVSEVAEDSDVVVALLHAPDIQDARRLADLFPQIHLIVSAHEGDLLKPISQHGKTYLAGAAVRARYLGRIDVSFAENGAVEGMDWDYLPVVEGWGRRPAVDALLEDYFTGVRKLVLSEAFQEERMQSLKEPPVEFVGNEACATCHDAETAQWQTTPHAHARETLEREEKDHDPECQKCHTTGFGFRTGFATAEISPEMWNVGCESCHGGGALHIEDPDVEYGKITKNACLQCHFGENSPDFEYSEYLPRVLHDR